MNYLHTYHAGCFADVLKHWVQTLCLQRLQLKSTPLAMIDTHAGFGAYDLEHEDAKATQEFQQGVAKLFQMTKVTGDFTQYLPRADIPPSFQCYLGLILKQNNPGSLRYYPGSAEIAVSMHRDGDNIHLIDVHEEAYLTLRTCYRNMPFVHIHHANAYQHVLGLLPPPERRGLVVVDPPFESTQEFTQLLQFLTGALSRFEHGCYLIWYPIKHIAEVTTFKQKLRTVTQKPIVSIEAWLCKHLPPQGLAATGVLLINPPFGVTEQLERDLPWLVARFSQDPTAQAVIKEL